MSTLMKSQPFREMEEMLDRFGRNFASMRMPFGSEGQEAMTLADWKPSVDIVEDEKEYLIEAELPEVKKEDVQVSFRQGVLSIHGERTSKKEEKKKKFHRVERAYGSFARSFALPEDIDPDSIRAQFDNGMLRVHIRKSEERTGGARDIAID